MPEGDTVWRTAHRLDQALAGRPLTVCDLRWAELATVDLRGETTLEVVSRGKHLLQRLDSGRTLHSHLRMDGQWRVSATDEASRQRLSHHAVRAVVGTTDWTAIGTSLGLLDLVRTQDEGTVVGHLGPDLLGVDWDLDRAIAKLRRQPAVPVGAALLDQRNLAGIGTMYAAESLFLQRQPPWQPVGQITERSLRELVSRAQRLLDVNRRRAIPNTTGSDRHGEQTTVHGRSGRPCRRCGGPVRVAMIGEAPRDRTMFYCPACQGGLGPTDVGRPQQPLGAAPRRRIG